MAEKTREDDERDLEFLRLADDLGTARAAALVGRKPQSASTFRRHVLTALEKSEK